MNALFELASRQKFRFDSSKGLLTAEDLWDLPLTSEKGASLDQVARNLHRQLKNDDNVSFVTPVQTVDGAVQAKFDIVKHVIAVRLAENEAANTARANREKKQKLLSILAQKEDATLMAASAEDIRAMIEAL